MTMALRMMMAAANADISLPVQANLIFWFRADRGVTKDGSDLVATWADQSVNGYDLTEATNKPLWVTGLINNKPGIRFDGTNDKLSSGAVTVNQPIHFFVVVKNISIVDGDRIFGTQTTNTTPQLIQRSAGPTLQLQSNGTNGAQVATDTTNFHLYSCQFNGTSSQIAKDNGVYQTNGNILTGGMYAIYLASLGGSSGFANIEVTEFFAYDTLQSGADYTSILDYINNRYSLW